MPSPRGTNHERLFMSPAVAAYDAEPDASDPRPMLQMFLAKLSDSDKTILRGMLDGDNDPAETASDAAYRKRVQAEANNAGSAVIAALAERLGRRV